MFVGKSGSVGDSSSGKEVSIEGVDDGYKADGSSYLHSGTWSRVEIEMLPQE